MKYEHMDRAFGEKVEVEDYVVTRTERPDSLKLLQKSHPDIREQEPPEDVQILANVHLNNVAKAEASLNHLGQGLGPDEDLAIQREDGTLAKVGMHFFYAEELNALLACGVPQEELRYLPGGERAREALLRRGPPPRGAGWVR